MSKGRLGMSSLSRLPEATRLRPDYFMSLDGFMQVAMQAPMDVSIRHIAQMSFDNLCTANSL